MAVQNIDKTRTELADRAETEQVYVDGDMTEAIFRALVDGGSMDEFEDWVESDLDDVEVQKTKWVGFGLEVTLK